MKTCTFIFWIYFLVLFPHGLFSKSPTNNEQYNSDSKNSDQDSEIDIGNEDVALHESFRPRHKYKANGRQTRVYRSENENIKEQDSKTPQCAVMYKDNEPVGILQPFKESYRFLPINGDPTLVDLNPIPVKRKTFMDVLYPNKMNEDYSDDTAENTNQFADDRYPSIFAKFKIDSRLDKNLNPDLNMKRSMYKRDTERPAISDEQVSSLKSTLSKMKGDNSAVVEEELKNILDDMGLIEDYDESKEEAKREVEEDENMEQGTNKINMMKEVHNETRNKRAEGNGTTEVTQMSSTATTPTTTTTMTSPETNATTTTTTEVTTATTLPTSSLANMVPPTKTGFEEDHTIEVDSIDLFKDGEAKVNDDSDNEDLERSTETELDDSRKKRQFKEIEIKEENNKAEKRDTKDDLPDISVNTSTLVKASELNEYEKRVEREIRDRIQKLKEEVKEEIKNLKDVPQIKKEEVDTRRKKRQVVNTLVDEESPNIDPNFNDENPQQEHHVRRKRSLFSDNLPMGNEFEVFNNTIPSSNLSDRLNEEYQMIDESKNGLPFIINFGDENPKAKKDIKQYVSHSNKSINKDTFNISSKATNSFNKTTTSEHTVNMEPSILSMLTPTYLSDNNKTTNDTSTEKVNNSFSIKDNISRSHSCRHNRCSICHRNRKDIQRYRIRNRRLSRKTLGMNKEGKLEKPKISVNETNRKANIIQILTAIGKRKSNEIKNSTTYQIINSNGDFNQTDTKNISFSLSNTNKNISVDPSRSIGIKTNVNDYGDGKTPALKIIQSYDNNEDLPNSNRRKRFIGISPILENVTNITNHYQSRGLKQYDEDFKVDDSYADDKILEDIQNIGKVKRYIDTNSFLEDTANITSYKHYQSRNLKQFNENTVMKNVENGGHIIVKRSLDAEEDEPNSDKLINVRRPRHTIGDSKEKSYQYDDPELNEEAAVDESQAYYDDQPYANDNAADNTNSEKSNCNCDKSGSGCKCGTQRTDLSVPNVKQEYSDYLENPRRVIEKKAASHCNCDKNGKHCKCQTFGEGSHYSDYDEEQRVEEKSSDINDDIVSDEVQDGAGERVPRLSREMKKNEDLSDESVEKLKTENLAEDYYENDDTEGVKVMKREVKPRKFPENQQFQNGEYFVDLHPDIYRLTPVEGSRKKRNSFKDLVAIHGGGPVVSHLEAVKQRSMLPHPRIRRRVQNEDNREPRQLIDMSDEDLFGALPQSFAGELARYKRVKRRDTKK